MRDIGASIPRTNNSVQDNTVVPLRDLLRSAIGEADWKHDAVAATISARTGRSIDGPYLSKMLTGEKPLPSELISALPDEIREALYDAGCRAHGRIVVTPCEDIEQALERFAQGLVGIIRYALLPKKAARMARVSDIDRRVERRVAGR